MIPRLPERINKVIVAPLNWGLGHATRSIPVIDELLAQGKEVVLASDGQALVLLRKQFPGLEWAELPPYDVRYKHDHLAGIVLPNMWRVFKAIVKERRRATKLVRQFGADAIITDSRFGFRSPEVYNVIISHQLTMDAPRPLFYFINGVNRFLVNAFDRCWVPDYEDHRLSGKLSKSRYIKNTDFVGPLSSMQRPSGKADRIYEWAIILSGPEPARSKLECEIVKHGRNFGNDVILIRGTQADRDNRYPASWRVLDLATRDEVRAALLGSRQVLSRSGYSSVMDYYVLGIKAYLIPTPGQSEQEYLARWLDGKYGFTAFSMEDLV